MNAIIEFFSSFPFKPIPYHSKATLDQNVLNITFWTVLVIVVLAFGAMVLVIGICCYRLAAKCIRYWIPTRPTFHQAQLVELHTVMRTPSINHPSYIRYETVDDIPVHYPSRGERRPCLFMLNFHDGEDAPEVTVSRRTKTEKRYEEIVETEETSYNIEHLSETTLGRHFQMVKPPQLRPHRPVSL